MEKLNFILWNIAIKHNSDWKYLALYFFWCVYMYNLLKVQINVKTLMLVQTPILKLRLDCFYSNLTNCEIRVNVRNKLVTLL